MELLQQIISSFRCYMGGVRKHPKAESVQNVIQKSCIPALKGVLVSFADGCCTLTGTDLTTWLTVKLPAQGDEFSFVLQKLQAAA